MTAERDLLAFDAFERAGKFHVPRAQQTAEIDTEHGAFEALAHVLHQISARVEHKDDDLSFKELAFRHAHTEEPLASEPAAFPAAYVESVTVSELDAEIGMPVVEDDKDVVTDTWALWRLGEDTGEGNVKVFATTEVEARALSEAVREMLAGNLDEWSCAVLPMPVRSLPPPFRDHFPPERTPSCAFVLLDSHGPPMPGAEGGFWVVDVSFSWRATRFTARRRLADLRPFVTVET